MRIRNSVHAAAVVVAALVLASCGDTHPSTVESKVGGTLPFGYVESPRPGDVVRGQWPVQGWALADGGIAAVDVFVDRNYVGTAKLGIARPDVQKAYPNAKDSANAGWAFTLNGEVLNPGNHELVVQARSTENRTRDIGAIQIAVTR